MVDSESSNRPHAATLVDILEIVRKDADPEKVVFYAENEWRSRSGSDIAEEADANAAGLIDAGLQDGDRVALISNNRPEWAIVDFGILAAGLVNVPIYPTLTAAQTAYILNDSGARVLFLEDAEQLNKWLEIKDAVEQIEQVIVFDSHQVREEEGYIRYCDWLDQSRLALENNLKGKGARATHTTAESLASIIYTSGTTGDPKGVMLTHGNFTSNVYACHRRLPVQGDYLCMSLLPLSHCFQRTFDYIAWMVGARIAYVRSIQTVAEDMKTIRPHTFVAVPRLFEKIYSAIISKSRQKPPVAQAIFRWGVRVGLQRLECLENDQPVPLRLRLLQRAAHLLVHKKIRAAFGGKVEQVFSGGGPLPEEIGRFFTAVGILIIEGYGLTETSPVITVNIATKPRFGSVGCALDNLEVKIAADGEILMRGPSLMKGYWNKPEATAKVIDADGFFHTGDIGEFVDGHLKITDRKKDLIITAGGKNIAPQPIENQLKLHRFVTNAVLIGDRLPYCTALIVPDLEELSKVFPNISEIPGEAIRQQEVENAIHMALQSVNSELARYESVKRFALLVEDFTIERGELTPTMKVKRNVVLKKHAGLISTLYDNPTGVD